MAEVEQISRLIADIYDAALDPSQWTGALDKARALVGGSAALIFSRDTATKRVKVHYDDGGLDSHYKQLYLDTYAKLDPFASEHALTEIGKPVRTAELLPQEAFFETRFLKEWVRPQQLVDFICAVLDRSATGTDMFGVFRHERDGLVDEAARRRMRLLVPHIRRAVHISRVVERATAEVRVLAETLEGLSAGLLLVEATGRIVHANCSARAMLQEGAILRSVNGRLVARHVDAAKRLEQVLAAAGKVGARFEVGSLVVPLNGREGVPHVAHVLPLTAAVGRHACMHGAAVAAMFVHKAVLELGSPLQAVAQLYNLTASERRVLSAIVQVAGVRETARTLGVSEATVKTHLRRLFGKTGAARQADLVRLVACFSGPVGGAAPSASVARAEPQPSASALLPY
jgi:DNA-binding CsgD family transcriptional regulator